ncbi:diguanylate cyclase (GGDEF)-like protein [Neobacillus niacini]|uniref:diguanylate cyclase n=1 Tax=Neobacillus niacini TaxID=86668 RepID=UPI0028641BA7|nr:diguanylate cyclase [Neobacillus niacini]MDR7078287.1 diguanylate cyclase (GGDEF)-like protein [Neobacillus niacini]
MVTTVPHYQPYPYRDVKVLYVEEEIFSREKLLRVLNRRFSDVHVAIDGEEGFQQYKQLQPDIIIVDINMSQMNGLEMIERIRNLNEKVQIIVTTANNDHEIFIQSIENNVNHFILKPIDFEKFLLAIHKSVHQIQLEKELSKQNNLTKAILDTQDNLLFVVEQGDIVEFNLAFSSFTGLDKSQGLHKAITVSEFFVEGPNYFYPKNRAKWIDEFLDNGRKYAKVKWRGQKESKGIFFMKAAHFPGEKQTLFVCSEITVLEEENKQNDLLAMMDPLTKSINRQRFEEILSCEIRRSKRYDHPFSIILFDIDHFNHINQCFGHQKGDEVLCTISTIVQQRIRESDIFARWGGDELILLTPETYSRGAVVLAESIRTIIDSFAFPQIGSVTCSFGIAEFSAGKKKTELVTEAREALSKSKQNRRNCVTVFNS